MLLKSWGLLLAIGGVIFLTGCVVTDGNNLRDPNNETMLNTKSLNSGMIALPKPDFTNGKSLEETLGLRKSVRDFKKDELFLEEISLLLWACQGIRNDPEYPPGRTAPSAGGFHPMEVFLFTPQGVFRYIPANHSMAVIKKRYARGIETGILRPAMHRKRACGFRNRG